MNRIAEQAATLIVGIGSTHGDDQAGWQVADALVGRLDPRGVAVRKAASPSRILDWLDDTRRLIVCDACRGLGRVGEVVHWTWPHRRLADASWRNTHDLPLPAILRLAERTGRLPKRVTVWAVEGAVGDAMATMSPEVAAALPRIVDQIVTEVGREEPCTNDHS